MKYSRRTYALLGMLTFMIISSCAPATPIEECVSDAPDGFISGIIHGVISPITFVVSLFDNEVAMYAVNNTGGWYDFGFLLGATIILGGGARSG